MRKQLYQTTYQSPLGELLLLAEEDGLCGLWFCGQKYFGSQFFGGNFRIRSLGEAEPSDEGARKAVGNLKAAISWLDRYFAGQAVGADEIPCSFYGSEFQKLIWKLLLEIPYGETATYGQLAAKAAGILGLPSMSAQAVGGAVGHNPISILVPCHRVVGAGGRLTGYAGGLEKKKFLLELEKRDVAFLHLGAAGQLEYAQPTGIGCGENRRDPGILK